MTRSYAEFVTDSHDVYLYMEIYTYTRVVTFKRYKSNIEFVTYKSYVECVTYQSYLEIPVICRVRDLFVWRVFL